MKKIYLLKIVIIYSVFISEAFAQTDSTKNIKIDLEFRPRAEFRYGYQQLRADSSKPAYFTINRSRINLTYTQYHFKFHTSIQDIRVFGQDGQKSKTGSLSVFEAYVDGYLNKNWFIRIGRQAVELDNKRLFSKANWDQWSRAHDGFNLVFNNKKVLSEAMVFFNQTATPTFGTDFSPTTFSNYKFLGLHHLKVKLSETLSLLTINSYDGYQSKTNAEVLYLRGTSGGRLTFTKNKLSVTASGYYQYGQLQSSQQINAYYFQPEIKFTTKKINTSLGMEYVSGDDATSSSKVSKSFVPLYGVSHAFMGHLDYFTNFPKHVKGGGLINPYLFLSYKLNEKLSLSTNFHTFILQNKVLDEKNILIDKYLGFENDLFIRYKINEFTTLDYEIAYMLPNSSMEVIKGGDKNLLPIWVYLMITFKPQILNQQIKNSRNQKS